MTSPIDVHPVCSRRAAVRFLSFPRAGMGMRDRNMGKTMEIPIWCVRKTITTFKYYNWRLRLIPCFKQQVMFKVVEVLFLHEVTFQ